VDETLERRRGTKIAATGVYRDPVRSSHGHFVKASGLRWVCLMLLVPVPWASRAWALPFLSTLAPSERYAEERGEPHKKITDWARQMLLLVRRWWPEREIVAVADSGYACIKLLASCRHFLPKPVSFVTRLRLDAALYEPAPPRRPGQMGRPRLKGKRLPALAVVASDPSTVWRAVTVADWYGKGERAVEVASATAVWYHTGLPPVPLRWVLIRDPQEKFEPQALLCTDLAHRSRRRTGANLELVRLTLEDGSDFPRSEAASRSRNAATVVGVGHPADDSRAFGSVLARHAPRPSADGAEHGGAAAGSVVPQTLPDFLRCTRAGAAGVVGAGGDFLQLGPRSGHGKSAAGVR
jgi:DDE superfamily endonuclease